METILSLDLSVEPCELTVSRITGNLVEVLARTTTELGLMFDPKTKRVASASGTPSHSLLSYEGFASLLPREAATSETAVSDSDEADKGDTELPEQYEDETDATEDSEELLKETVKKQLSHVIGKLREGLSVLTESGSTEKGLGQSWTSAAVILPAGEHLSFNVNLPFGDPKNLNRIVDLEVQDLVPFDIDEFFVHYASLGAFRTGSFPLSPASVPDGFATNGSTAGTPFDVHVGLIPRHIVKNSLALCKAIGIEPRILTTPASALGATYHLARSFFKENSIIIHARGDQYSLVALINGEVRMEHTVLLGNLAREGATVNGAAADAERAPLAALRLIMAATERRYEASIAKVFVLGDPINRGMLQQALGRPVEAMEFTDILKPHQSGSGLAPLAAVFAQDDGAPPPLSNMRMREFSFGPKLSDIVRACRPLLVPLASVAAAVVIGLGVVYGVRAYDISQMESQLLTEIRRVVPDFEPAGGNMLEALQKARLKLSEELGVLGSPSKISPLQTLSTAIASIPADLGVTIQTIKISDKLLKVSGTAPDYSAIDKLESSMKKHFSAIKKSTGSSSTQGTKFDFDITLS